MNKKAFLYVILAGMLWATSGIFVKLLSQYGFSTLHMTAMRGSVSAFMMLIYLLIFRKKAFKVQAKELLLFACSGVSTFLVSACYFASMQRISVSVAVILMYIAPVVVMIYSVLFLKEKFTLKKGISIFLMIFGCAFATGIVGETKLDALGIVFGFCSGLMYSAYNIFTKIQMQKKCSPFSANFYSFVFMSIAATAVSNPQNMISIIKSDVLHTLPICIGIGLISCALPYFIYTIALKHIPAGTASTLSIVEPMTATLISIFLFKEPADIFSVCGIVMILAAVFILSKSEE